MTTLERIKARVDTLKAMEVVTRRVLEQEPEERHWAGPTYEVILKRLGQAVAEFDAAVTAPKAACDSK